MEHAVASFRRPYLQYLVVLQPFGVRNLGIGKRRRLIVATARECMTDLKAFR